MYHSYAGLYIWEDWDFWDMYGAKSILRLAILGAYPKPTDLAAFPELLLGPDWFSANNSMDTGTRILTL